MGLTVYFEYYCEREELITLITHLSELRVFDKAPGLERMRDFSRTVSQAMPVGDQGGAFSNKNTNCDEKSKCKKVI